MKGRRPYRSPDINPRVSRSSSRATAATIQLDGSSYIFSIIVWRKNRSQSSKKLYTLKNAKFLRENLEKKLIEKSEKLTKT